MVMMSQSHRTWLARMPSNFESSDITVALLLRTVSSQFSNWTYASPLVFLDQHIRKGTERETKGCDKHRVQGVALALNKQAYSSLIEWFPIASRILKARFNHHHGKLTVIVSYAPTNLAKDNVKHGFFSAVADTIASVSRHDMTIALGDYNATVSSSTQSRAASSGVIGPVSPDNTNDNGDRLVQMCATHGLAIANTWFPRKRIHQYTWLSNDGRTKKMIDHIMINRRWL